MAKNTSYQRELEILKEDFEDLKKYLDELRKILPVAICTLTSFWVIADINKSVASLTEYKPLEIIGQPVDLILGEKKTLEAIKKEAERGRSVVNKETTLNARSQRAIPVNISLVVRRDRGGTPIGYFLTIVNITKIKKYQKDLEGRIDELETLHKLTLGRELKMIELKKEIEGLTKQLEKYKK